MLEYWKNGRFEYWNAGKLGVADSFDPHSSTIPSFHYSGIPVIKLRDLYQTKQKIEETSWKR
ncbi:MAG: hypothetical protein CVU57_31085 [Deltaproteobacteria bacterium HGW-Deltaproteobacteria-15]|jgi:hypothetical protein|nr:MAG: hypothetical protein CVU57_31085 [Deltaproteobacteria bacterium HGW-Deltaproteobacteria-15]